MSEKHVLRVAVIGERGSGRSTFINAFLRDQFLPEEQVSQRAGHRLITSLKKVERKGVFGSVGTEIKDRRTSRKSDSD